MKIQRIILKNLNSLRGPHAIDFTDEPLATAGLFAITGATGAGKSTILDAITLALYGRAARYGTQTNPEDMMSRHCGECSAEVEFEVSTGQYRAEWKLRRARGKSGGKIQAPKRYIYHADGVVMAQQVRDCDARVVELTGLDYDRFVRSVMLAQGEFARFLKASANERAELLESLTATSIYSELGILTYREATRREIELNAIKQALEHIETLEDKERKEIEESIATLQTERSVIEKRLDKHTEIAAKIDALDSALRRQTEITKDLGVLELRRKDAESDLTRLERHRKTAPFQDDLIRLDNAEVAARVSEEQRREAQRVRDIGYKQRLQAKLLYSRTLKNKIGELELTIHDADVLAGNAGETLDEEREWLETRAIDAHLSDGIADLAVELTELRAKRTTLRREWEQLSDISQVLSTQSDLPAVHEIDGEEELKKVLNGVTRQMAREQAGAEAERSSAENDLGLRRDHLHKARVIADHETHRANLVDGEPCPLCGATEHPYAKGREPAFPFAELEAEVSRATETLDGRNQRISKLHGARETLGSQQSVVIGAFRARSECEAQLSERLCLFDVGLPGEEQEDETRRTLQGREKEFQTHRENLRNAEQAVTRAREDGNNARELFEKLTREVQQLGDCDAGQLEVEDDVEESLNVEEAEKAWHEKETACKVHDAELETRLREVQATGISLRKSREALEFCLTGSAFRNLDELRAARLDHEKASGIEQIEVDLRNRESDLTTRLNVANEDAESLRNSGIPEGDNAVRFKAEYDELRKSRDTLIERLKDLHIRIELDDGNRRKLADQQELLDAARKEAGVWNTMRRLIGSHDGAKFRKYAQSISLDILIRRANDHLGRLSDRYRIRRLAGEELQLEIEDLHQAGATRPMTSLSGGESFLASLALALGLSELAGRNVRIDSLFIDEGFGSLDSDVLDLAIGTLESLHQHNKSVGVISHVELLKQRITTQIQVIKQTAGDSILKIV